jgi:phosphatidylglycerol:prolipoprotein diacylglycerol transferase
MPNEIVIGPISIKFYGIILMLGALAGAFLAEREARRRGMKSDIVWDGLIWVLIGGIVGARLWHVFTPPPSMVAQGITTKYYLTHPLDLINTRLGGLGIPGAVIGGGLALYLFTRRRKLNFLVWADIAAPAVALGQAIGRWGNFVNQELYGKPTDLPWGITIESQYRLPEYANVATYHPLFLYESLWNFANMGFLLWLSRSKGDKLLPGDVFLTYLIIYPVGRFFLEFLRLDSPRIGTINTNQTAMLIVVIISAAIMYWRHRRGSTAADDTKQDSSKTAD